ncbi:hypothetical protein GHT09_020528 [Marmota monax]|uniref:Uncharacterized protein n=1 Tax=Marmota monax TaxID=9995 RepID=A0A834PH73_MARMO|nr:hypothetical protein GHT09_020528 [Marmota monax]
MLRVLLLLGGLGGLSGYSPRHREHSESQTFPDLRARVHPSPFASQGALDMRGKRLPTRCPLWALQLSTTQKLTRERGALPRPQGPQPRSRMAGEWGCRSCCALVMVIVETQL